MLFVKVKKHTDPGHGWFAVKRSVLEKLNVLEKISSCSFQSKTGKMVYLEEDLDASILFKACENLGIKIEFSKESYSQTKSPVRSYPNYKLT